MRKFVAMTAMLILAGVSGAIAQGSGNTGGPVIVQPGPAYSSEFTAGPAVRQRQPRRGAVPADRDDRISTIDAQDAELDRKIRSICRGC